MSETRIDLTPRASARVRRRRGSSTTIGWRGRGVATCRGPDGRVKWRSTFENALVDEGANAILDIIANAGAQPTFFLGLINDGEVLDNADTAASHAGWTENTNYSEATRPTWNPDAASGRTLATPATVDFSIDTNAQIIAGVFAITESTKGGTTGFLLATALFTEGDRSVDASDTLEIQYSVSI